MSDFVSAGRTCAILVAAAVKSYVASFPGPGAPEPMSLDKIADRVMSRVSVSNADAREIVRVGVGEVGRIMAPDGLPYEEGDEGCVADLQTMLARRGEPLPQGVMEITRASQPVTTADEVAALVAALRGAPPSATRDMARLAAAASGTAEPGAISHKPISLAGVDVSILKGADTVVRRATNNQVASVMDLLTRVIDSEKQLAESATNQVTVGGDADTAATGSGVTYVWRCRSVAVSEVFEPSKVKADVTGAVSRDDVLAMRVNLWSSTPPHPKVPEWNPHRLFDLESLVTCLNAVERRKTIGLVGPTGSGKTTMLKEVAARLGRPFFKVPVDGEIRRPELFGTFKQFSTPTGSETRWCDGILLQAIRHPAIVDLDEFDRAEPNLLYAAHQVLEHEDVVVMEDGGRVIRMHPDCAVAATANTKGRSDATGLYASSSELSEASRNRITFWVDYDYMSPEDEAELLRATTPTLREEEARKLATFAQGLRAQLVAGDIRTACSTRQMLEVAEWYVARKVFDRGPGAIKRAITSVILKSASDETDTHAIAEAMKTVFG